MHLPFDFANSAVRFSLAALLAVVAVDAFAGGVYGLMGAPSMSPALLTGSPFASFFVPSLVLFVVVGGACCAAAVGVAFGRVWGQRAAFAAGGILLVWIAVQVWIIGLVSWLQPAVSVAGAVVVLLAALLPRPSMGASARAR